MRRVLYLHLPRFSVELVARRAAPPVAPPVAQRTRHVVLTETNGQRVLVMQCCPEAARAGVRPGMALADAQPLLGIGDELLVRAHDPARDARALAALGQWALRLSPGVALCSPDGLLLEAAGFERLIGDEACFAQQIVERTRALGITARCAVASTVGTAWALARFGNTPDASPIHVTAGGEREALGPLPIEALRLEPATCRGLRELGVERVGHLLALERKRITGRFGGHVLQRLDQALGQAWEPVVALRPKEPVRIERISMGLVRNIGAVLRVAEDMVHELADELGSAGIGVRTLILELAAPDHSPEPVEASFGRVTASAKHLWTMLRPRAEKMQLGFGIERITLVAAQTERLPRTQSDPFAGETRGDGEAADRLFGELVDLLAQRLGTDAVRRVRAVATHIPERAFETRAAKSTAASSRNVRNDASVVKVPRPTIVLRSPESIHALPSGGSPGGGSTAHKRALDPTNPPIVPQSFRWRGKSFDVATSDGPECIDRAWWIGNAPPSRAYFRVCTTSGRHLWLCLEAGQFSVHGEWA